MAALLARLATSMNQHKRVVLGVWLVLIVGSLWFALHQQDHLQGGGWEVPGSQAKRANELLRSFNGYSVAGLAVVVDAPIAGNKKTSVSGDRYRMLICCAPTTTLFGAFGSNQADIAAKIARDGSPDALALGMAYAQPPGNTNSLFATGKTLSNLCADVIQLEKPSEIEAVAASVPPAWRALVRNAETTAPVTAAACKVWGVPPSPRSTRAPVRSSIPTIVLTGEYDQVIYPGEGRDIAKALRNARLYSFPGLSHITMLNFRAQDTSCPRKIAVTFLDRPGAFPASGCIASMREASLAPAAPAGSQVPFRASYAGTITHTGLTTAVLRGTGVARYLGKGTNEAYVTIMRQDDSCVGGAVAASKVTLTGADGDMLNLIGRDVACSVGPGRGHETGIYVVTGGTGRFENATGEGTLEGNADTARGRFTFKLNGTVSKPDED